MSIIFCIVAVFLASACGSNGDADATMLAEAVGTGVANELSIRSDNATQTSRYSTYALFSSLDADYAQFFDFEIPDYFILESKKEERGWIRYQLRSSHDFESTRIIVTYYGSPNIDGEWRWKEYRSEECSAIRLELTASICPLSSSEFKVDGNNAVRDWYKWESTAKHVFYVVVSGRNHPDGPFSLRIIVEDSKIDLSNWENSRVDSILRHLVSTIEVLYPETDVAGPTTTREYSLTPTSPPVTNTAIPATSSPTPTMFGPPPRGSMVVAEVVNVVDGDTIDVLIDSAVYRVRYIGIDAPETKHPDRGIECFGPQASQENFDLVAGARVYLEKDVSETDVYGRLLRYVWLIDPLGEPGDDLILVNSRLVRNGFATVSTYPPDVKYQNRFIEQQRHAMEAGVGLWGSCR